LSDGPWIFQREILETAGAQEVAERARRHRMNPAGPPSEQKTFDF
jgi:hypothetical protein